MHDSQTASVGWFRLGLDMLQVAARGTMTRSMGASDIPLARATMRAFGIGEAMAGLGLLTRSGPRASSWLRVAGDVVDLVLLSGQVSAQVSGPFGRHLGAKQRGAGRRRLAMWALLAVATVGAKAVIDGARRGTRTRAASPEHAGLGKRAPQGLARVAPPKPGRVAQTKDIERASVALDTPSAGMDTASDSETNRTPSQWTNQGFGTTRDDEVG